MFHELAINCSNFSFSKKGRSNCAGRRISIRKGGEAMDALAGSVVTCAYDANGNITEYVSGGGVILSHSEYSSFGRELVHTGSDDFTHRFSTKPLCRKMGVLEYQLRKYRPWCGRWINRDAIEEDGGLNLYGFVWNASIYKFDNKGNLPLLINLSLIAQLGKLFSGNCWDTIMAWKPGGKNDSDANDGYRHCQASCDIANSCGAASSMALGYIKEMYDIGRGWIEDILNMIPDSILSVDQKAKIAHELQGGTYDDSVQDFLSNYSGLECALSGGDCAKCCECSNPK